MFILDNHFKNEINVFSLSCYEKNLHKVSLISSLLCAWIQFIWSYSKVKVSWCFSSRALYIRKVWLMNSNHLHWEDQITVASTYLIISIFYFLVHGAHDLHLLQLICQLIHVHMDEHQHIICLKLLSWWKWADKCTICQKFN
mgnify:CR=1 FL=1